MTYMMLILEPAGQRAARTDAEGRAAYQRMLEYAADLRRRGALVAADALKTAGVRFTPQAGGPQRLDGPFAESKELIGGFFLIDAPSQEEALVLARACPATEWATVEVREIGTCYE
ncbi:MAG: dehydrogenase [Proteobacteria bacterium]|nr:dehydrogenase [Pseudomonadota bacterium]